MLRYGIPVDRRGAAEENYHWFWKGQVEWGEVRWDPVTDMRRGWRRRMKGGYPLPVNSIIPRQKNKYTRSPRWILMDMIKLFGRRIYHHLAISSPIRRVPSKSTKVDTCKASPIKESPFDWLIIKRWTGSIWLASHSSNPPDYDWPWPNWMTRSVVVVDDDELPFPGWPIHISGWNQRTGTLVS